MEEKDNWFEIEAVQLSSTVTDTVYWEILPPIHNLGLGLGLREAFGTDSTWATLMSY
jgi:hypothetical protein